jgi:hypothetical protein
MPSVAPAASAAGTPEHRVVIGERHRREAGRGRTGNNLLRRQRAVGRSRVHVQVGEGPDGADVFGGAQR